MDNRTMYRDDRTSAVMARREMHGDDEALFPVEVLTARDLQPVSQLYTELCAWGWPALMQISGIRRPQRFTSMLSRNQTVIEAKTQPRVSHTQA